MAASGVRMGFLDSRSAFTYIFFGFFEFRRVPEGEYIENPNYRTLRWYSPVPICGQFGRIDARRGFRGKRGG